MSNDKQKTLSYIQEMFKDRVDDESIKLVFAQCQHNVDETVIQLLALTEHQNTGKDTVKNKTFDSIDPIYFPSSKGKKLNVAPFRKNKQSGASGSMFSTYPSFKTDFSFSRQINSQLNKDETCKSDDYGHIDSVDCIDESNDTVSLSKVEAVDKKQNDYATKNKNKEFFAHTQSKSISNGNIDPENKHTNVPHHSLQQSSMIPHGKQWHENPQSKKDGYCNMNGKKSLPAGNRQTKKTTYSDGANAKQKNFTSGNHKNFPKDNNKRFGYKPQNTKSGYQRMNDKLPPESLSKGETDKVPKSVTILRGLPGSGKSTLARQLAASGGIILSSDDFFYKGNEYCFVLEKLQEAHVWNQERAKRLMETGLSPLFIDNTNTQMWEMRPYVMSALKCNYEITIKEPRTSWKWNLKELERRNIHGVNRDVLERMIERYERNVTVDKIVHSKPPVKRESVDCAINEKPYNQLGPEHGEYKQFVKTNKIQNTVEPTKSKSINLKNPSSSATLPGKKGFVDENKNVKAYQSTRQNNFKGKTGNEPVAKGMPKIFGEDENQVLDSLKTRKNEEEQIFDSDKPLTSSHVHTQSLIAKDETFLQSNTSLQYDQTSENHLNALIEKPNRNRESVVYKCKNGTNQLPEVVANSPQLLKNFDIVENSTLNYTFSGEDNVSNPLKDSCFCREDLNKTELNMQASNKVNKNDETSEIRLERLANNENLNDENIRESVSLLTDKTFPFTQSLSDICKGHDVELPSINNYGLTSYISGQMPIIEQNNANNFMSSVYFDVGQADVKTVCSKVEKEKEYFLDFKLQTNTTSEGLQLNDDVDEDFGKKSSVNQTLEVETVKHEGKTYNYSSGNLQTSRENMLEYREDTNLESSDGNMSNENGVDLNKIDSVTFLKDCFPQTKLDVLKSFLDSCHGDVIKTVDLLLRYNDEFRNQSPFDEKTDDGKNCYNGSTKSNLSSSPSFDSAPKTNCNSYNSPSSSSSSSPTTCKFSDVEVDALQLTLDPAFALQLIEMFGAFSGVSTKDILCENARTITLGKEFAKNLYNKWRKNFQANDSEKKSHTFSPAHNISSRSTKRKFKTPSRQFYLPDPVQVKHSSPSQPEPVSLKEIMDEQFAIHVSQMDQESEKDFLEQQLDFSIKIKKFRLHGLFPGVDEVALNEILQANNYDLDTTIKQVQSSCNKPLVEHSPTTIVTEHHSLTKRPSPNPTNNDLVPSDDVDKNYQSLQTPSYQDYRTEAQTHFQLRAECIKKAALAYSKKQGELAKVYADQARGHGERMQEANRRAAEKIVESRNRDLIHSNTLDLHELHVNEAITVLDNVLEERRRERKSVSIKKSPGYLEVITGRGNRSRQGKARIKPAIIEYLKRHKYRYEELNSGLYRVYFK